MTTQQSPRLLVCGAAILAATAHGATAASIAEDGGHDQLAGWLHAAEGWAPLRVAAVCRLHRDAAVALRLGLFDPDPGPAVPAGQALAAVRAAQREQPALPWSVAAPAAVPVCAATAQLVAAAAPLAVPRPLPAGADERAATARR